MSRRRRDHRTPPAEGRAIHLVDVDNLVGDPRVATREAIRDALAAYRIASGFRRDDLVVLATNPGLALEVGLAWPGARLLSRNGVDGADLALVAEAKVVSYDRRVSRVVIGSGDHIFGPVATELRAAGFTVAAVSRRGSLARSLRSAVDGVAILPSSRPVAA
jgi:hypothetical protein